MSPNFETTLTALTSDNMKIKSSLQDISEIAVSNMHNISVIKLKLSKASNMANHLEQQISKNIKFTNDQLIAVDKKIAEKSPNYKLLTNKPSTPSMSLPHYNNKGHHNLLPHDVDFHKFKEKLTSEIKEMLKPDDLASCDIKDLSNKLSTINSITQDHNKIISDLQIAKHVDNTITNDK
eukprot:1190531-Ditylum_brightwellii.AAC.1